MMQMTRELYEKLETLTYAFDTELAGFLIGDVENGQLILKDVLIPEQEATSGDVEFKEDDLLKLRSTLTDDEWKRIVGHWHSHVKMGVFWSGTDETLINEFSKTRKKSVFIVTSVKDEKFQALTRVVLNEPFRLDADKLPVHIIGTEIEPEYVKIAKERVKKKTYAYTNGSYFKGAYDYGDYDYWGTWKQYKQQTQTETIQEVPNTDPNVWVDKDSVMGENIPEDLKHMFESKYPGIFKKCKWYKDDPKQENYDLEIQTVNHATAQKITAMLDALIDIWFTDTFAKQEMLEYGNGLQ
jgi:hypothetical protein